jgi:HlyD family secretion protein
MKARTKWILGTTAVVAITAIGLGIFASRRAKGVEVRLETAETRDLESVVNASGYVRPHRKVDVQADIMGRVTELDVKEGDRVTSGQLLLRIDPAATEAALQRARAALSEARSREAQARAQLIQVERARERALALAGTDSSLISRETLEETETQHRVQQQTFEAARFNVEQARAAVGEAEDRLSKTVIRAPMDGIITRLNVDRGETAIVGTMNNPGSLLLTVADLSVMEAVVRVDETDIPHLEVGDSASLEFDAFPGQLFWGRVTDISHSSVRPPESQQATAGTQGQAIDFEVVIAIEDPPARLRSDLSATADIVTDRRAGALSIPIIALTVREQSDVSAVPQEDAVARAASAAARRRSDVEGVFVVRAGVAEFVPVQVGIAGREHFAVLSGLSPGDSIVAGPYEAIRTLQNGDRVRPLQARPEGRPVVGAVVN